MGLSFERLTRPRNTMVTNFFIIVPLDAAGTGTKPLCHPFPGEELGSRQRCAHLEEKKKYCCRGDLGGKEKKKRKKPHWLAVREGGVRESDER